MKTPFLAGLIATFALTTVAYASNAGMARSAGEFQVARSTEMMAGGAQSPLILAEGDKIVASETPVMVSNANGQNVFVGEASTVTVGNSNLHLENGGMAVSQPASGTTSVTVNELSFAPIATDKAGTTGAVAIERVSENEIKVQSMGQNLNVTTLPAGNQVAVLGATDALRFVRNEMGVWTAAPVMQAPTDGGSTAKRGGPLGALGLGGGAAGGGATTAAIVGGTVIILGGGGTFLYLRDEQRENEAINRANNKRRPPVSGIRSF